ncbi:MAG: hypothetical protein NC548_35265 [Lachnospiraceae bacterium]|nr:hypothetical protein [Lachnospiraceae bacterium]
MSEEKNSRNALKKPMTTEEFFNKICSILKEKNLMPDILDYALATHDPVPMTTYEFDLRNNLGYGGNEGIYIHLWIEYYQDGMKQRKEIGTFKTLGENREDMHVMGKLLADFIVEEYSYVNSNLDDFTWEGADVHAIDENGNKLGYGYSCGSMERALKKMEEILKRYPAAVVRDNRTRKEKIYKREIENK